MNNSALPNMINNPDINNRNTNRSYGVPQKQTPWNAQYYPRTISQNVLSIATVRDMELVSIPFIDTGTPKGPYDQMVISQVGSATTGWVNTPTALGSVPWGVSPRVAALYNTDENPMMLKFSTSQNGTGLITSSIDSSNAKCGTTTGIGRSWSCGRG